MNNKHRKLNQTTFTGTVTVAYTTAFCLQLPIAMSDACRVLSGVSVGGYPADAYAGGNPWQLLTAVAEIFFLTS